MRRGAWLVAGLVALAGLVLALLILLSAAPERTGVRGSRTPTPDGSARLALGAPPAGSPEGGSRQTALPPGAEAPEAEPSPAASPGTFTEGERPGEDPQSGSASEELAGGIGARRSGNWVLDPEIHQQILEVLPEEDQVPYLSVRLLKLATQTLRHFPPEEREATAEARSRVAALRRRIAERKLATSGDPAAAEALRVDLLRLDREVEAWRERVLAGEPIVPEFVL